MGASATMTIQPSPTSGAGIDNPTVVCAWCNEVLAKGSRAISHGLCSECMPALVSAAMKRQG